MVNVCSEQENDEECSPTPYPAPSGRTAVEDMLNGVDFETRNQHGIDLNITCVQFKVGF